MARSLTLSHGLMAVVLAGCGSGGASLIDTVPVLPGDDCLDGGLQFNAGIDEDGDGVLSDAEIADTVTVCNGTDGAHGDDGSDGSSGQDGSDGADGDAGTLSLVRTTPLEAGDPNCPAGGTLFEVGLDDGDGGETAGDGVLGDGEVDGSQAVCTGEDEVVRDTVDEPAGAAGGSSLDASGGDGTQAGGAGGQVSVGGGYGNRAHVKVFSTGAVDASFALPTVLPDTSGAVVLSSDSTIPVFATSGEASGLSDGDLFRVTGSGTLYVYDSTGSHGTVDDLVIEDGATIVIEEVEGQIQLELDLLVVEGTLAPRSDTGATAPLVANADFVHIASSGLVDATDDGENGGNVSFYGDVILFEGTVDVSASDANRDGGRVELWANYAVYSTGQLLAYGADGNNDNAGFGGQAYIGVGQGGMVYDSSFVDVSGGDDVAADGGWGGIFAISGESSVSVRSSATVDASGGFAGGEAGGRGGEVYIEAYGGYLSAHLDVDVSGGESTSFQGGDAGTIGIFVGEGEGGVGPMDVSGTFNLRGGDGPMAGNGGALDVYHDTSVEGFAPVTLYGFDRIDVHGGDAQDGDGGPGGRFNFDRGSSDHENPAGGVVNYADIDASGGAAVDPFNGGTGGGIEINCEVEDVSEQCFVLSRASYDASCGAGGGEEGGGSVGLVAATWVDHVGDIDFRGTDNASGNGSHGGELWVEAVDGDIVFEGDVDGSGGDGGADGASGGQVGARAGHITWTGDLDLSGGGGEVGGSGGEVDLRSLDGGTTLTTGASTVDGGAGGGASNDGSLGEFLVDGIDIAGTL